MMELNFILIVSSLTLISYSVAFKQPPPLVAFVDLKTQHLTTKNCESLLSRNQHVIVPVSVCLNNQSHKGITSRLFGSRTLIYEPSPGDVRYDFKEGEVCLTSEKRDDIKGVTVPECLDEPNNILPLKPSTKYPHLLFPVTKDCTVRIELTWHKDIPNKKIPCPERFPSLSVMYFWKETIDTKNVEDTLINAIHRTTITVKDKSERISAFEYFFSCWNKTTESKLKCLYSLLEAPKKNNNKDDDINVPFTKENEVNGTNEEDNNNSNMNPYYIFIVIVIVVVLCFICQFSSCKQITRRYSRLCSSRTIRQGQEMPKVIFQTGVDMFKKKTKPNSTPPQ